MWIQGKIVVEGDKPICIKKNKCPFFSVEKGITYSRQKEEKIYFTCTLGIFKMTHIFKRIPKTCNHKYNKTKLLEKYRDEDRHTDKRKNKTEGDEES